MVPRRSPNWPCFALAFALAASPLVAAGGPGETGTSPVDAELPPALVVEQGSIAREAVVAVGRGVVVYGEALADVAALDGPVRVVGRVGGDVIALGGNVELAAGSRVEGDVFVLGGHLSTARGAYVGGRSVSYPSASRAWLTLLEGPSLGGSETSTLVLGAKLALLAAWAALLLLFFATAGRAVLSTAESVGLEPFRAFGVGLVAVLAMLLTALLLSGLTAPMVGVPLLVLVVLFALVLKLWGMVAVFHALGAWIYRRLLRRRALPLEAASLGLLVLGVAKFVPFAGAVVWTVATLIGVGATLVTKFGRREPWFRVEDLDIPPALRDADPVPPGFAGFRRPR
jgi:hypothetical protein